MLDSSWHWQSLARKQCRRNNTARCVAHRLQNANWKAFPESSFNSKTQRNLDFNTIAPWKGNPENLDAPKKRRVRLTQTKLEDMAPGNALQRVFSTADTVPGAQLTRGPYRPAGST